MAKVTTMATAPPVTTRMIALSAGDPPSLALKAPVAVRAMSTATKVTGIRSAAGGSSIAINGRSAPTVEGEPPVRAPGALTLLCDTHPADGAAAVVTALAGWARAS